MDIFELTDQFMILFYEWFCAIPAFARWRRSFSVGTRSGSALLCRSGYAKAMQAGVAKSN